MKLTLYKLLLINNHVVTQVIKAQLIIGDIGNITSICCTSLLRLHVIQNHANSQAKKLMNLTHPLGITLCQIIVNCYNVDTSAFQGIQICRKSGNQSLTFAGSHLCDTSLVKDNSTDKLYLIVFHPQYTFGSFTNGCKCFRKEIIQRLALFQALLVLSCLIPQLFIG